MKKLKTKCLHGHKYTPENTRISTIDGSRICRICHRIGVMKVYYKNPKKILEKHRIYRKIHPEIYIKSAKKWLEKNRVKQRAHEKVARALRENRLKKQPCKICGKKKVDGHHPDYSKPLEVIWLCRLHHIRLHKTLGGNTKI